MNWGMQLPQLQVIDIDVDGDDEVDVDVDIDSLSVEAWVEFFEKNNSYSEHL